LKYIKGWGNLSFRSAQLPKTAYRSFYGCEEVKKTFSVTYPYLKELKDSAFTTVKRGV